MTFGFALSTKNTYILPKALQIIKIVIHYSIVVLLKYS